MDIWQKLYEAANRRFERLSERLINFFIICALRRKSVEIYGIIHLVTTSSPHQTLIV